MPTGDGAWGVLCGGEDQAGGVCVCGDGIFSDGEQSGADVHGDFEEVGVRQGGAEEYVVSEQE